MAHFLAHIGDGKCGSTSIQRALFDAKDHLAERGVSYPVPAGATGHAGFTTLLGRSTRGPAERGRALAIEFMNLLGGLDRIVLSSEHLIGVNPTALDELVQKHDSRISKIDAIAYVRAPHEVYLSRMQQRLKGSSKIDKPHLFVRPMANSLRRWRDWGKTNSFSLRLFDRRRLSNGDVVSDFSEWLCDRAGLDSLPLHSQVTNSSMTAEQAITLQRLRADFLKSEDGKFNPVSHDLVILYKNLGQICQIGTPLRLSGTALSAIVHANRQHVEELNSDFPDLRMHLPDTPGVTISDAPWIESNGLEHVVEKYDEALVTHLLHLVPEMEGSIFVSLADRQWEAIEYISGNFGIEREMLCSHLASYWRRRSVPKSVWKSLKAGVM